MTCFIFLEPALIDEISWLWHGQLASKILRFNGQFLLIFSLTHDSRSGWVNDDITMWRSLSQVRISYQLPPSFRRGSPSKSVTSTMSIINNLDEFVTPWFISTSLLMTREKYAFVELVDLPSLSGTPDDSSHEYAMTSVMPTTLQGIPPTAANWSSSFLSRFRALSTTSVSQQQQRERSFINKPAKKTCCLINEVLLRQTPFGRAVLWRRRLRRVMHLQPPLRFFRYRSGPLLRSLRAA